MFTVFTPTFNRAHTLERAYWSLQRQVLRSFKWLIIDDGSTDGTRELIARWQCEFVHYVHQEHRGKHVAWNRAVDIASDGIFVPFDSDDELKPTALATLSTYWHDGLTGLITDCELRLDYVNSWGELVFDHGMDAEKFACYRTDILRKYPFPELKNTNFIPEGYLLYRLPGKFRVVDEACRIYHANEPDNLTGAKWRDSWRGMLFYYDWLVTHRPRYFVISAMRSLRRRAGF